jgi:7-keto-8-aminopelargonate synthetase-like enzyme
MLQQVDRTYVLLRGRKLSYFGGCDYFRLASHPAVHKALHDGLNQFGLNVAASRLTTGNHELYEKLERQLADFFAAQSAVLLSSGYVANLAAAQALAGDFSHVLIDDRAHGSLLDAARFFACPIVRFKHRDPADLQRVMTRLGRTVRPILLTEGMFSHDGEIAPLREYLQRLPTDGIILLDDSHGGGVLGKTGKGTLEQIGVSRQRIIQTITLSKAFGVYGGAILGTRALRSKVIQNSGLFVGNTPLPLPLANAALVALQVLKSDASLRQRLLRATNESKTTLRRVDFPVAETPSPIIAVLPRNERDAEALKKNLLAAKIHPPFIKYPGSPPNGYFRFALSSEHTRSQLDALLDVLVRFTSINKPICVPLKRVPNETVWCFR